MRSLSLSAGIRTPHVWSTSRAGLVKERINAVKRLAVSTGKLSALLHLHIRPIDPVVFREPMYLKYGKRHLAEGFTLIYLQRLSWPYVAIQLCPERDNWRTRGTSLPVLSY